MVGVEGCIEEVRGRDEKILRAAGVKTKREGSIGDRTVAGERGR